MFEYVKDLGLKFAGVLTRRTKTDLIVLHHFESDASAQAVHVYHQSLGHKGIDYNIVVQKNGEVVWGRGLEYEGGHVSNSYTKTKGVNARSVGIACQGNFNLEKMGEAQKDALRRVVADVVIHYGFTSVKQIVTHKEIAGADYTDCPGTYFPADEIREYIRTYGQVPVPPIIEPPAELPVEETPKEPEKQGAMVIDHRDPNQVYPVDIGGGYLESGGANKENQ